MPRRVVLRLRPKRRPVRSRRAGRPRYFHKASRSLYRSRVRPVHLNVKRATCGRLMTLQATAASAGATCTFNAADNLFTLTTAATNTCHYFAMSCAFCLDDIPAITDFTNLFDLYRFNCVVMRFFPVATQAEAAGTLSGTQPAQNGWIHHITDDDDYVVLTPSDVGIDEIRQYANYKVNNIASRRPIKRKIYPKISMAGSSSGGFNVAVNSRPKWINCGYSNAIHFAFKCVFEIYNPTAASTVTSFKLEPIYYLSFKNLR